MRDFEISQVSIFHIGSDMVTLFPNYISTILMNLYQIRSKQLTLIGWLHAERCKATLNENVALSCVSCMDDDDSVMYLRVMWSWHMINIRWFCVVWRRHSTCRMLPTAIACLPLLQLQSACCVFCGRLAAMPRLWKKVIWCVRSRGKTK